MAKTSTTDMPRFRSYLMNDNTSVATADRPLSIDEAMKLVGDELDRQIKIRKDLLSMMGGTLYPSIVRGEIEQLEARKVRTDRWHGLYR